MRLRLPLSSRSLTSSTRLPLLAIPATLIFATTASAVAINPAESGLDLGQGCTDTACFFPGTVLFNLDASAPVSGDLTKTGLTLDYSIDLASALFNGSDGPVTDVTFSDVNYSGTATLTDDGNGQFSFLDMPASISGTLTPAGAGSAVAFNLTGVNTSANCQALGNGLTCGFVFGAGTAFQADVNGNARYWRHTVDATIVPEPGSALLTALGLGLLATRRTR